MSKKKRQTPISAKLTKTPPKKPKNISRRSREYLTDNEIERLRKAARRAGRHGVRGHCCLSRHCFSAQKIY